MPKHASKTSCSNPVSLLILEGDTEEVFYTIIKNLFLRGIRVEFQNIKGQGNVNNDVLYEIYKFTRNKPNDTIRVYCCVDTERQNQSATPLDLDFICEQIRCRPMTNVLSIDAILADPEIESWFFYDIEGIYKYLKTKLTRSSKAKFCNPKNLCKKDLQQLFFKFEKAYISGKKTENFIKQLDINKIVSNCKELRKGIQVIKDQANNLTNHLFPNRKS